MLPPRVKHYLLSNRGLSKEVIASAGLDWDGMLVIPLPDGSIKRRRDPDRADGQKYLNPAGVGAQLYGADLIPSHKNVFVCEGELDALRLRTLGYCAVTSTCGAMTFRREWVPLFRGKRVLVWMDSDEGGRRGAERATRLLASDPTIEVWRIDHPDCSCGKDVTEILKSQAKGWRKLCLKPVRVPYSPAMPPRVGVCADRRCADIVAILDRYGIQHGDTRREMMVKCPFHSDSVASMSVNTEKQLWHCFTCGIGGSGYGFVMRMENCDFKTAKKLLE